MCDRLLAGRTRRHGFQVALLIVIALCALCNTASAQDYDYWINPAGGNYEDGANWLLGSPPVPPSVFNTGSSGYEVQLTQNVSLSSLEVETDNVTLNLNGYTYDGLFLVVGGGAGNIGSLTLQGPGTFGNGKFASISVGNNGGAGQLIVNGASENPGGAGLTLGGGSTVIVENGGSLAEGSSSWSRLVYGNLIVNNGTVTNEGEMDLGSATLTNGANIAGSGTIYDYYANILVDDSSLSSSGGVRLDDGDSLALTDGGFVGGTAEFGVALPASTTIMSGAIESTGQFRFGNSLTMQLNLGPQVVDENGTPTIANDEIITGGNALVQGDLDLVFPTGFMPAVGDQFSLFNWDGSENGSFSEINTPALPGGEAWDLSGIYTTGTVTIVPEPTSIGLMLAAGGLLLRRGRKCSAIAK